MTKKQLIIEILSMTNQYKVEQLIKLWYAELKILHHHLKEEKGVIIYDIK